MPNPPQPKTPPNPQHHTVADLASAIESFAPLHLAEPWDNVGLLIGTPTSPLTGPVLLTIDLSQAVADEAISLNCSAVIAYHPPIFSPLKRLTNSTSTERIVSAMLRHNIAVYSPHTALDACTGGVTDWLADGLLPPSRPSTTPATTPATTHPSTRFALRPAASHSAIHQVKLVTFAPADQIDTIRHALAAAGAGIIANYHLCSFASPGEGSFFAAAHARPAVGKPGQLERIEEHRLEMICSQAALPLAIEALKRAHPYEAPPIDIYPLQPQPMRSIGAGRCITLDQPTTLSNLAARLHAHLALETHPILIAPAEPTHTESTHAEPTPHQLAAQSATTHLAPTPTNPTAHRIAIIPGSGAELAELARLHRCDTFITGEMKHHEILACIASGLSVILAGHTQTERGYLPSLARKLAKSLPGTACQIAHADRPPTIPFGHTQNTP